MHENDKVALVMGETNQKRIRASTKRSRNGCSTCRYLVSNFHPIFPPFQSCVYSLPLGKTVSNTFQESDESNAMNSSQSVGNVRRVSEDARATIQTVFHALL